MKEATELGLVLFLHEFVVSVGGYDEFCLTMINCIGGCWWWWCTDVYIGWWWLMKCIRPVWTNY